MQQSWTYSVLTGLARPLHLGCECNRAPELLCARAPAAEGAAPFLPYSKTLSLSLCARIKSTQYYAAAESETSQIVSAEGKHYRTALTKWSAVAVTIVTLYMPNTLSSNSSCVYASNFYEYSSLTAKRFTRQTRLKSSCTAHCTSSSQNLVYRCF